jgi:hypothetical protein
MQSRDIAPAFDRWLADKAMFEVDAGMELGRVANLRQTVSIADVRGEDIYADRNGRPR